MYERLSRRQLEAKNTRRSSMSAFIGRLASGTVNREWLRADIGDVIATCTQEPSATINGRADKILTSLTVSGQPRGEQYLNILVDTICLVGSHKKSELTPSEIDWVHNQAGASLRQITAWGIHGQLQHPSSLIMKQLDREEERIKIEPEKAELALRRAKCLISIGGYSVLTRVEVEEQIKRFNMQESDFMGILFT